MLNTYVCSVVTCKDKRQDFVEKENDIEVVHMALWIGNQSERSNFSLDQSESRISPM